MKHRSWCPNYSVISVSIFQEHSGAWAHVYQINSPLQTSLITPPQRGQDPLICFCTLKHMLIWTHCPDWKSLACLSPISSLSPVKASLRIYCFLRTISAPGSDRKRIKRCSCKVCIHHSKSVWGVPLILDLRWTYFQAVHPIQIKLWNNPEGVFEFDSLPVHWRPDKDVLLAYLDVRMQLINRSPVGVY